MKKYFSVEPTQETILKAIEAVGLSGLNDGRWIISTYMKKDLITEVINELKKCYYPVFVKQFLDREMTFCNYMTVIRQLLKHKGLTLERKEHRRKIDTSTYQFESKYRIIQPSVVSEPAVICFD